MSYLNQFDESGWPVVYARFEGPASIEGYDDFANRLATVTADAVKRKRRFVCVLDARGKIEISADVRRHIAAWTAKQQKVDVALGSIVIFDSTILRGVITAISWVSREQMTSVSTAADGEQAWRIACEVLQAAGLQAPQRPAWALARSGT